MLLMDLLLSYPSFTKPSEHIGSMGETTYAVLGRLVDSTYPQIWSLPTTPLQCALGSTAYNLTPERLLARDLGSQKRFPLAEKGAERLLPMHLQKGSGQKAKTKATILVIHPLAGKIKGVLSYLNKSSLLPSLVRRLQRGQGHSTSCNRSTLTIFQGLQGIVAST